MSRKKNKSNRNRLNTMKILALGFLAVILAGTALLCLPICNRQPIAFDDALFTAVSAVCVTGLLTIVPAQQFTMTGQAILLVLIQIGGLGVIACGTLFVVLLHKKVTVKGSLVIREAYNMSSPAGMVRMVMRVIKGTIIVEAVGSLMYAVQFVPQFGLKGIWYAVFHGVSTFCNAGIDVLGAESFKAYTTNPVINFTAIGLIIVSGIGFTVWWELTGILKKIWRHELKGRKWFSALSIHAKLAITVTIVLLAAGTANFFLAEYSNPETMGGLSLGEKLMASLFHSTSTRTAGFATVSQAGLTNESKFFSCILMFIGGSPGGTAGGVKTTTAAMIILTAISTVRGGRNTECFRRTIPNENIRTGHTVIIMAIMVLFAGTMAVCAMEPDMPFIGILYETSSAIGTVGLSADLTSQFSQGSRVILMLLMYAGRLGPVTLALLFGGMAKSMDSIRELPQEHIMVG